MVTIKERIRTLLLQTKRRDMDGLLQYMDENGFYSAPCSTSHHLCSEGGLAEHSLNVYHCGHGLLVGGLPLMGFNNNIDSWSIISLLHDIGKCNYRGKPNYVPNILKSGKISDSKPYETNKDRLYIPHEVVSLQIISKFIELTEEEEFAIMYHNGLYVPSGRDIQGKERPLQLMLHFCDMWCSRFVESEGDNG